jgi:hypothetical protein
MFFYLFSEGLLTTVDKLRDNDEVIIMDQDKKLTYSQIMDERKQSHITRQKLYKQIGKKLGVPVISYFTSFRYPVMIDDSDADLLEGVLRKTDVSKGFALLISSPGGNGLAAERIINICQAYSGNKKYSVIVPGKAKSAATMVCLGAEKLIMSETSELGSIDPQYVKTDEKGKSEVYSAYNIIMSYKKIFEKAINHEGPHMEPFLQALAEYDPKTIEECMSQIELSQHIAIKALQHGMYEGFDDDAIKDKIKIFLVPTREVKDHGRPIYYKHISDLGLNIDLKPPKNNLWEQIYELYLRLNLLVSNDFIGKCIESETHSFVTKVDPVRK